MTRATTASGVWAELQPVHSLVLAKAERFCELTIRRLIRQNGQQNGDVVSNDAQSAGAMFANHLANKMAVAMWSPTRPNFRLEVGPATAKKIEAQQLSVTDVNASLAVYERRAVKTLNRGNARARFVRMMQLLIITGNALLDLRTGSPRVLALPYYAVKRNIDGRFNTLIIKESVCYDELTEEVRAAVPAQGDGSAKVDFYTWCRAIDGDRIETTVWVNETRLPDTFTSITLRDECYLYPMVLELADEDDYGTGVVEDCEQDFESLAAVSTAVVDGAIVSGEIRWLVNPNGVTRVDTVKDSRNGDWLAGAPTDISPVSAGNTQAVQQAMAVAEHWERRLGRMFLMETAITRDAERVTAEEVRRNAMEIETGHAGAYSSLSAGVQMPIAHWMLRTSGVSLTSADIEMMVITGLDALSRAGDLEALSQALDLLGKISNLPSSLAGRLKMDPLARDVGNGFGIDLTPYLMSDKEYGQALADAAEARALEAGVTNEVTQGTT